MKVLKGVIGVSVAIGTHMATDGWGFRSRAGDRKLIDEIESAVCQLCYVGCAVLSAKGSALVEKHFTQPFGGIHRLGRRGYRGARSNRRLGFVRLEGRHLVSKDRGRDEAYLGCSG
jgi:hypothetical protein